MGTLSMDWDHHFVGIISGLRSSLWRHYLSELRSSLWGHYLSGLKSSLWCHYLWTEVITKVVTFGASFSGLNVVTLGALSLWNEVITLGTLSLNQIITFVTMSLSRDRLSEGSVSEWGHHFAGISLKKSQQQNKNLNDSLHKTVVWRIRSH